MKQKEVIQLNTNESVQLKILVPITTKNSIKSSAQKKSMTITDYILNLHKHDLEQPIYSNDEQKAAIRNIGLHLNNALQSLQLGCDKISLTEIKEALKYYETLV